MQRASHALVDEGRVWLVDPVDVDELDERIRAVGEPVGVIQLLDRHGRDCAALAERYGIPLHRLPFSGVTGSPFDVRRSVDLPRWREAALWWPARRTLIVADALGTASYFLGRASASPFIRCCASFHRARSPSSSRSMCSAATARGCTESRRAVALVRRALDLAPWHPALAASASCADPRSRRRSAVPLEPRYASRPRAIPKSA